MEGQMKFFSNIISTQIFHLTGDITIDGDVRAKLVTFRGDRYLEPTSTQIRISFKDYYVRLEKLFKDQQLSKSCEGLMNEG